MGNTSKFFVKIESRDYRGVVSALSHPYRLSLIAYRLSLIAYRLSLIAYRLSLIAYRLSLIARCVLTNSVLDWLEQLDQIVEMPDFLQCQTFRWFGACGAARDTSRQYGLSEA